MMMMRTAPLAECSLVVRWVPKALHEPSHLNHIKCNVVLTTKTKQQAAGKATHLHHTAQLRGGMQELSERPEHVTAPDCQPQPRRTSPLNTRALLAEFL